MLRLSDVLYRILFIAERLLMAGEEQKRFMEQEMIIVRFIKTLRQSYLNKDAILSDLDNLDYEDKHYKRRKADLEDRLSKTYDKIEETENALVEAKAKKRSILAEKVCGDNIYKALIFFDKMYEPMNEAERREFLTQFIEKVEIYEEEQANGQWLKSIEFKLPIISKDMKISLDNGSQIEAVGLIMGIDSLCGMFRCMSNCLMDEIKKENNGCHRCSLGNLRRNIFYNILMMDEKDRSDE